MDYLTIGGRTFRRSAALPDLRLEACSLHRETAISFGNLAFDTMTASVFTKEDGGKLTDTAANTPVNLYRDNQLYGSFVLSAVSRNGPYTYTVEAVSPLSRLVGMEHPGGIYTGQTAESVIREICGSVPVLVESVYRERKLYGYLPYAKPPALSARDNLAQVLFVIGAHLGTDRNGVLRVEKLWDGVASHIGTAYEGGSVTYETPVSAVSVTAHQYIPGTEEAELFDGTAEEGTTVIFSEPMHTLTASGVKLLSSGANFAVLSAGTGTLTGKKYTHNTTVFRKTVSDHAAESEMNITDATLVSPLDGYAAALRLAEYCRCRTVLKKGVVAGAEKPGHVVRLYDPYERKTVAACIKNIATKISGTTRNDLEALVNFRPQQPENAEYFDTRQLLTGSGTIPVPEGVSTMTLVLIGGGQGGGCGHRGGESRQKNFNWSTIGGGGTWIYSHMASWATGGKGGAGGLPGSGGRVRQVTVEVQPGSVISYACGTGGAPAAYDPEQAGKTAGAEGGATTLTVGGVLYSTAEGAPSSSGFVDPTTGEVYGASGKAGISGGDGSGVNPEVSDLEEGPACIPTQAGGVTDEDGRTWNGGGYTAQANGQIAYESGSSYRGASGQVFIYSAASAVPGSGAAAGCSGQSGAGLFGTCTSQGTEAVGGDGLKGADAQPPKRPTAYGAGGSAGNGGGGGGAPGYAVTGGRGGTGRMRSGAPGPGGDGSEGSAGADGCILLYFHQSRKLDAGPVVSKTKWYLDRLGRRFIV